ncbi:Gp49 family protein [Trinickia sp. NRRL B-1857]|uniref:Gp49 family protein n=1 Tax=Trinickia sp. NRRL B-1857 TaxID=3162879 RepID=UPI003D2A046D
MNMATQAAPRNDDETIEQEIVRKGKTALRVTPQAVEAAIAEERYFTAAQGAAMAWEQGPIGSQGAPDELGPLALLTFCVLVLRNGFTVTGESACASPENFDSEIGRKIARQNAVAKIWPLEGYLLKQRLREHDFREVNE